jgi:NhaA family Na+:H+ antiporter
VLPAVAAIGGMIVPAMIYVAYVRSDQAVLQRGWAIPCATDIAFSLLAARWIFRRHPAIPFLLLLAIADDALGLVVLALFYPVRELHVVAAAVLMAIALGVSMAFRRRHVRTFWPYVIVGGAISWAALFWGGLHPALALVPIVPFLPHGARDPGLFVPAPATARDALSEFEHRLKVPVQVVLFLFGLVNAGVQTGAAGAGTWAVLLALVAGKPLGVGVAVATAVAMGLRLPPHLGWREVVVVGCAAGIGFTVALFFATAAFPAGPLLAQTKLGALLSLSSAAVAIVAAWILRVGRFTASRAEGL